MWNNVKNALNFILHLNAKINICVLGVTRKNVLENVTKKQEHVPTVTVITPPYIGVLKFIKNNLKMLVRKKK